MSCARSAAPDRASFANRQTRRLSPGASAAPERPRRRSLPWQARRLCSVSDKIDDLRAELKLSGLIRREKAGACIVGFPPKRPIELRRVADRFVNGQPEVRGMKHKIIFARLHGFGRELGHCLLTCLLRFGHPRIFLDVLVTPRLRPAQRVARLEVPFFAVNGGDCKLRKAADEVLLNARAVAGGEELLLVNKGHTGVDEADPLGLHRRFVEFQEKLDLFLDGNIKRVFLKRALPACDDLWCGDKRTGFRW